MANKDCFLKWRAEPKANKRSQRKSDEMNKWKLNDIKWSTDELREFDFFKNIDEEQAAAVTEFLADYAVIVYNVLKSKEREDENWR